MWTELLKVLLWIWGKGWENSLNRGYRFIGAIAGSRHIGW